VNRVDQRMPRDFRHSFWIQARRSSEKTIILHWGPWQA